MTTHMKPADHWNTLSGPAKFATSIVAVLGLGNYGGDVWSYFVTQPELDLVEAEAREERTVMMQAIVAAKEQNQQHDKTDQIQRANREISRLNREIILNKELSGDERELLRLDIYSYESLIACVRADYDHCE